MPTIVNPPQPQLSSSNYSFATMHFSPQLVVFLLVNAAAGSPARTGSLSNDDLVAREDRRGSYTVPGLGSRKQAILKAGGNTLDIAIAMLETETMLTDYAYGKQVMALSAISSMSIY